MPTIGDVLRKVGKLPTSSAAPRAWQGDVPTDCQVCHKPLGSVFYDMATRMGPWGILCHGCATEHGLGLGTGRGQKYDAKTGVKLAG